MATAFSFRSSLLFPFVLAIALAGGCAGSVEEELDPGPANSSKPVIPGSGGAAATGTDPVTKAVPGGGGATGAGGAATGTAGTPAAMPSRTCTGKPTVPPSPLRRLNRVEYDNSLKDLLGDDTKPGSRLLPREESVLGFDNNATARGVSFQLAEAYMLAAEDVSVRLLMKLGAAMPCDPRIVSGALTSTAPTMAPAAGGTEDACADSFIKNFGKRAFRRPLNADEVTAVRATFEAGKKTGTFLTGVQFAVERLLQEGAFLYRVELGASAAEPRRLSSFELASRLSYFLLAAPPDATLMAAASNNGLNSVDDIAKQTQRLLADPRAHEVVRRFHEQWLNLDELSVAVKDTKAYPLFKQGMLAAMKQETERFIDHVIFEGAGDVATLLTAPFTFVSADNGALYGMPEAAKGSFTKVILNPAERAGLLTQPSLLTMFAKANQTSPILRGQFVRAALLCSPPVPPPPDANVTVPEPKAGVSTRERFVMHTANPTCAGCHTMLDPIGFGFENYDGIGMWRTTDAGKTIDASGELVDHPIGKFNGAVELAKKLAAGDDVRRCMGKQWFRFAFGRQETDVDSCTLSDLDARFAAARGNVRDFLVALATSDAFLTR